MQSQAYLITADYDVRTWIAVPHREDRAFAPVTYLKELSLIYIPKLSGKILFSFISEKARGFQSGLVPRHNGFVRGG